jgi:hypothetical protein
LNHVGRRRTYGVVWPRFFWPRRPLSLLPLWEKVASPTGLASGKPEDRLREVG